MIHIGKIIVISVEDGEEEVLERVLSVLTNEVQIEPMQADTCPVLQYPGLEIRLAVRTRDICSFKFQSNTYKRAEVFRNIFSGKTVVFLPHM